jgi:uncharacterized membrane protein
MAIIEFLQKYFINPIYTDEGYNFYNTIVYAIIALIALIGIYKSLQKLNFKIDNKFFYAVFPFILFGSSLRAFVDAGFYKISFWTVSPGIYIMTAAIFFATFLPYILINKYMKIKFDYWKLCFVIGFLLTIINFGLVSLNTTMRIVNLSYGFAILGLSALISIALWFSFKKLKFTAGLKNFLPFPAHILDASATFIAVDFLGAVEKHPFPTFMTSLTGTAAIMFLLKLAVLIPLVYLLDKNFKDKELVTFILIAVAVLGFAQGIRDFLTLIIV